MIEGDLCGDTVPAYARNAQAAGLDGVVWYSLGSRKYMMGTSRLTVTPGNQTLGDGR